VNWGARRTTHTVETKENNPSEYEDDIIETKTKGVRGEEVKCEGVKGDAS
jgi:hypothetical protein